MSLFKKGLVLLLCIPVSIFAFKPGDWFGSAHANNHHSITMNAIRHIVLEGETLTFEAEALKDIADANGYVDGFGVFIPSYHCDAEFIHGDDGCNRRLVDLKKEVFEALNRTSPNIDRARTKLGRAYHTLQDFYSHSNWVNLDRSDIYADLTNRVITKPIEEREPDAIDNKTCEWDLHDEFYRDDKPKEILELGSRGNTTVTTGYFETLGLTDPIYYKCNHGGSGTGLNKDTAGQHLHAQAATVALKHTKQFLLDILNGILSSTTLTAEQKAKNIAKFLGEISTKNIGFVVDTTGSMGSTITGIKSAMTETVNRLNEEGRDVENFYLISYGDPHIGNILTATDADSMLANINSVQLGIPDGGGDYEELALDGLIRVVAHAAENTELYLYTDAPTKNDGLTASIIQQANDKNIKINFFLSGGTDVSYNAIAYGTGGAIIPYAHTVAGAEGTFAHINPSFDGNLEELLKITGVIPGTPLTSSATKTATCAGTKDQVCTDNFVTALDTKTLKSSMRFSELDEVNTVVHDINVDNSSEKIMLNIAMNPIGNIKLFRPDGTEALEGDSDITIVTTSVSESITITAPIAGTWKVSIQGTAGQAYTLDVNAVSDLRIIDFSFAELKGRAGHEGLFPVNGQPLNTVEQYVTLSVAGDIKSLTMKIIALDGSTLNDIALTERTKNDTLTMYIGKLSLPNESFRIVIVGEDTLGASFERVYNQVYVGQSISVKPVTDKLVLLQANKLSELAFTVTNTGVSDKLRLTATKEDGSSIALDETEITLDINETRQILVRFTTPSDIGLKETYNVTLSAVSTTNSDSSNYAVYKAEVNDEDLDNDGVSDKMEKFISDGNKDGVDDYNQSNVISMLSESGTGFTFVLKDSNFTNMLISEVPDTVKSSIEGDMPFGLLDFTTESSSEMKIIYKSNIYPTEYYKYDTVSNSYIKDATAVFEKGEVTIFTTSNSEKGFLVFNNTRPTAFVVKQSIFKNESITLDLLEKSNDKDGDTIRVYHVDNASDKNGTIVKVVDSLSKVTYTAPTDYNGTDYFQYKITDDKGGYYSVDVEIEIAEETVGGGCTYNPNSKSIDVMMMLMMLMSMLYLVRNGYKRLKD